MPSSVLYVLRYVTQLETDSHTCKEQLISRSKKSLNYYIKYINPIMYILISLQYFLLNSPFNGYFENYSLQNTFLDKT